MDNILFENCNNLNDLFELWKKEQESEKNYENTTLTEEFKPIEKNSFIKDGYIDKNEYKNSSVKVLFILKEANIWAHRDAEKEKGILPDTREQINWYLNYINEGKTNRPKQHEKMGRMAFYLQNKNSGNAEIPTEAEYKEALKSCAFMNMNKRGGKEKITEKYYNYINKYKIFILKQIEMLNPDYIIILGSNIDEVAKDINEKYKNKVIYMWHTAYQMKGQERRKDFKNGSDSNVDCYMREFFKRVGNHDTK